MAGLIKNQILKHLSKFVVNLSPSQISLSALKGEGELTGLELNCSVLTQLLELPVWVRLVSATCNRAAIRIQWTKLKTVPIQLCLDEIRVMIETCDKPAGESVGSVQVPVMAQPQGYYGFTDKVVDGICLSVNLVHVTLSSLAFTASFQMSRILVESKSPSWQKASLPHTRLKDMDRGEVLIFKELSWQTVRIEARSTVATELTPLRLITNQARCRMTLKKRMSDCAILGVRLVTILDDLLWVLTDDQLKAALHFVGSVSGLVKKATEETQKAKAARKLDNSGMSTKKASQTTNRMFAKYDVTETSYHFYSDRIDLHFCDDPGGGRSHHPSLQGGGAFQVSLARLQADYYPYHLARGDRKHWVRYNSDSNHRAWLLSNLASFDTRLLDVVLSGQNKTPLSRTGRGQVSGAQRENGGSCDELRDLVVSQLSRLMTTNIVLRLGDLTLWRVSTSSSPSGKSSQPTEMLKGDCVRLHLPPDLPLIHLELSQFYYPGDMDFPLPPPCLLLTINPVTVMFDVLTLVWLNAFALNLEKCVATLQKSFQQEEGDGGYADVKVELVMPRIVASPGPPRTPHPWRPSSLQISASKISISNYRSLDTGSRADLANALDKFQQSPMFFGGSFPCTGSDPSVVSEKFWSHATGTDTVREPPPANISQSAIFRKDLLWTDARDVWCCAVASVWAEFEVSGNSHVTRPVPLLDATPLSVWVYARPEQHKSPDQTERPNRRLLTEFYGEARKQEMGVEGLVVASQPVSLQLDHHQLLFLLRLVDSLAEMGAFLSSDSNRISAPSIPPGTVIGGVLPQLDISIILAGDRDATVRVDSPQEEPSTAPEEPKSLEPVLDLSDPLSANLESVQVTPEPPVKLQLQPAPSNGLFSPSQWSSTNKSRNLTSSLHSKLDGLSVGGAGPRSPEPDLETLSVRSDESGDSSWHDSEAGWTMVSDSLDIGRDSLLFITSNIDIAGEGLFKVDRTLDGIDRGPSPAEMAEEVYENEKMVGGLEQCPEERIISVLTLHLGRLAMAQISRHDGSSLLLDSSSLSTSLGQDQDYQQFQFRFGQSGKSWSESVLSAPDSGVFKLRIDSKNIEDPAAALRELPAELEVSLAEKISRISSGSLELEVNSANLEFLSSTLTKLSEWAQDEILPTPLPMTINLKNLTFKLTDDNPAIPGCPQPPPLDFNIPVATLFRDKAGIFHLSSKNDSRVEGNIEAEQPSRLDENLRQQLDLALAEVRVLRARLAEKDVRIGELEAEKRELVGIKNQAHHRMDAMVEEKKSLLDTLKYLQEELVKSGKK